MFILTTDKAKANNYEQSFSAQEIGKSVKRLTIPSVGKGTGPLLAGTQIGTASLEDILATVNNTLNTHNPSSSNFFSISPREIFILIYKEPYQGGALYHCLQKRHTRNHLSVYQQDDG